MAPARGTRVRVRGKGRRAGSTRWLERHLNDPHVQSARQAGYRSRAAYKLLEIDRRFGLLKPGRTVVDLGSAPGSWSQVAAARGCRVIGLDLAEVAPLAGATLLQGDVFDPATPAALRAAAGGPVAVVLSDMAAASTGQRAVDRLRAEALGEAVLDSAARAAGARRQRGDQAGARRRERGHRGGQARVSRACTWSVPRRPIAAPPRSTWLRSATAAPRPSQPDRRSAFRKDLPRRRRGGTS